ncbi:MAG: hypothetical protein ABTQ32_03215 [Myxococcaceae bacterium]
MRAVLLLVAISACSPVSLAVDAGVPDAGARDAGQPVDAGTPTDAGNPSRFWDGGSCAVKTDCPCFSSDDCAPTFRCFSEDTSGTNIWCLPGPRGAGVAGDVCTSETDCASALCIEPRVGAKRCSQLCDAPADCPSTLPRCLAIGFGVNRSICSPPP